MTYHVVLSLVSKASELLFMSLFLTGYSVPLAVQTVLVLTTRFNKSFVCTGFKWSNSSIWLIDRTLSGATTPGRTPHSPKLQHCLMSYLGHVFIFIFYGGLTLCRDPVGVFYSPSWLNWKKYVSTLIIMMILWCLLVYYIRKDRLHSNWETFYKFLWIWIPI